jgi:hypothetical protein
MKYRAFHFQVVEAYGYLRTPLAESTTLLRGPQSLLFPTCGSAQQMESKRLRSIGKDIGGGFPMQELAFSTISILASGAVEILCLGASRMSHSHFLP